MSENILYPNVDPKKINIAPEEFTLNDLGVIELDASYDILTLEHGGRYFCRSLGEGAPISGAGACIDVYPSTVNDRVIVIHYRHNNTSWQRAMYNGVWGDWKLIAGEMPVWAGNIPIGTTKTFLAGVKNYSAFGHLLFRSSTWVFEVPVPKNKLNESNIAVAGVNNSGTCAFYLYNTKESIYILTTALDILQVVGRP